MCMYNFNKKNKNMRQKIMKNITRKTYSRTNIHSSTKRKREKKRERDKGKE